MTGDFLSQPVQSLGSTLCKSKGQAGLSPTQRWPSKCHTQEPPASLALLQAPLPSLPVPPPKARVSGVILGAGSEASLICRSYRPSTCGKRLRISFGQRNQPVTTALHSADFKSFCKPWIRKNRWGGGNNAKKGGEGRGLGRGRNNRFETHVQSLVYLIFFSPSYLRKET